LTLEGGPVSAADFEPHDVLQWEYGVTDTVRHVTWISVRRISPGRFLMTGDAARPIRFG